jgi:hypothetical protein
MIKKIISGGQTGADMAGLVVAKDLGIPTGGTAPQHWMTEKGCQQELLESFGLVEGPEDERVYIKRTMMNIEDSDGTLVFRPFKTTGTNFTIGYAQQKKWTPGVLTFDETQNIKTNHKPLYVIRNFDNFSAPHIVKWIEDNKIETLNVAGPRESHHPGLEEKVSKILKQILLCQNQTSMGI